LLRGFGLCDIAADGCRALHARRDLLGDARLERFTGNRHAGIDDDDVAPWLRSLRRWRTMPRARR